MANGGAVSGNYGGGGGGGRVALHVDIFTFRGSGILGAKGGERRASGNNHAGADGSLYINSTRLVEKRLVVPSGMSLVGLASLEEDAPWESVVVRGRLAARDPREWWRP